MSAEGLKFLMTNAKLVAERRRHTTNSALHRETRKTYVARLQFYTPCDNILTVLLTEIA